MAVQRISADGSSSFSAGVASERHAAGETADAADAS
jgi:hypothetical protein